MDKNLKISSNTLESMILSYCRMNTSFFLKIKPYLDTNKRKGVSYFNDPKNQRIFNIACQCFDKLKVFPVKKTLLIVIEKIKEEDEIKLLLNSIINKIFETDKEEIDPEFIEKETEDFIKEAKAYEAILYAQQDIEDKNYSNMVNRIEEAARISFDKDLGLSIRDVDESLRRIRKLDQEARISTGYTNFDNIIDSGMHSKEIVVFSSIPGGYKTGFMGNIAINCFLEGKKCLVFTFETSSERLSMRYFQNIAEMSKLDIINDEEGLAEKAKEVYSETGGDIILKEYNTNSVCANDLMAFISDLQMHKKWVPDIVFVDYLLLMQTNDKTLSSGESYRYFKIVTEEVRNIAKSLYIPVVTACQINREGMSDRGGSKATLTAKSIAESRGIFDTADIFITIAQTAADKKKNNMYISFVKNRNDRTGVKILFSVDYEHHKLKEEGITS